MHPHYKSLFQNFPYPIYNMHDVYIPFCTSWKNIGIALSGGADSAILAYMICDIIDKHSIDCTVHVVSNIRMWKTRPWQRSIGINVYNFICSQFTNIKFVRHENFVPPALEWGNTGPSIIDEDGILNSGDIIELKSFGEYIGHTYNLNAAFLGVNKNPSTQFDGALIERDVSMQSLSIDNFVAKRNNMLVFHPFRALEKDKIIKLYYEMNIPELLSITRSCEGDKTHYPHIFKDLDYTTYVANQYVPECGECFWCKERKWGIENASK